MKTQVLHLDRHDDVSSVQDKIAWAKSERILLVWPHRSRYLNSQLDLVRIYRHCDKFGARMALVARKPEIIHHAERLNIPVFRSVRDAQRIPWESDPAPEHRTSSPTKHKYSFIELQKINKKEAARPQNIGGRLLTFFVGILAFVAVISIFMPSAIIKITPQTDIQTLDLDVIASTTTTQTNLSGAVPAQVHEIIVEGQDSITPSGTIEIPQEPATGEIEFTNLTDREIYIPSGTTIRTKTTPSLRFHTLAAATLPAEAGISILLEIEAENPGSDSNLPAGSLIVIDGELGLSLATNNPTATTGGSERSSAAPNAEDYEALKQRLLEKLWQEALNEVISQLNPNDFIINANPKVVELLDENYVPAQPAPASVLELTLRVEYEILVVTTSDLNALAHPVLDRNLGEGFSAVPDSLILIAITEPEFTDDTTAHWTLRAQRTVHTLIAKSAIANLAIGKSANETENILANQYPFVQAPEIELSPNWWPWLPLLPFRIEVIQ